MNTQSYGHSSGHGRSEAYSHEVSGAYVFRLPLRRFTPFALAGAAALVFDPKDYVGATTQTRPTFIYGAGADFNVSKRVLLRAVYRGLVYRSPTYDLTALSSLDRVTHRAEPTIGFGYRF